MTFTIYTKQGCTQCVALKRKMALAGLAYDEFDITGDEYTAQLLRDLNLRSLPQVFSGATHPPDFNPFDPKHKESK